MPAGAVLGESTARLHSPWPTPGRSGTGAATLNALRGHRTMELSQEELQWLEAMERKHSTQAFPVGNERDGCPRVSTQPSEKRRPSTSPDLDRHQPPSKICRGTEKGAMR